MVVAALLAFDLRRKRGCKAEERFMCGRPGPFIDPAATLQRGAAADGQRRMRAPTNESERYQIGTAVGS